MRKREPIELIERQAAIDAIHCNIVVTGRENAELVAKTMGEFVDRIKALPSIQPEKAQLSQQGTTSDLISRHEARHALCKAVHKGEDIPCENQTASCLWTGTRVCDFVREIDALPTIQPEVLACGNGELVATPEPQWIPVGERMPKDYVDVLVWFEYFRYGDYNCMYATHGIGNYSKEYNSWTINHETGWKDLHVFAWMPLPEPYGKEDGQDEQA